MRKNVCDRTRDISNMDKQFVFMFSSDSSQQQDFMLEKNYKNHSYAVESSNNRINTSHCTLETFAQNSLNDDSNPSKTISRITETKGNCFENVVKQGKLTEIKQQHYNSLCKDDDKSHKNDDESDSKWRNSVQFTNTPKNDICKQLENRPENHISFYHYDLNHVRPLVQGSVNSRIYDNYNNQNVDRGLNLLNSLANNLLELSKGPESYDRLAIKSKFLKNIDHIFASKVGKENRRAPEAAIGFQNTIKLSNGNIAGRVSKNTHSVYVRSNTPPYLELRRNHYEYLSDSI